MKKVYDLESDLDIASLEQMHFEICLGISKSKTTPSVRVIPHYEQQGLWREAVNYKNTEIPRIAAVADDVESILSPEQLAYYNGLSYIQKRNFLELFCNGYRDGDFVRLKMTKSEYLHDKFATFYDDKTEWIDNCNYFPNLIPWIKQLPFREIGRILIFITHQYKHSDLHYDRRDEPFDGRHHFIWLNPNSRKKFFIVDGYNKEYLDTKAAFFDTSYLHGADPVPYTTYSIRVDGQLDKDFCDKHGILWGPR
jgi:hypothetical protein